MGLSHPLPMDTLVFTVPTILHWGTVSGAMVATTGALICSAMISLERFVWGHVTGDMYKTGLFDMSNELGITTTIALTPEQPRKLEN